MPNLERHCPIIHPGQTIVIHLISFPSTTKRYPTSMAAGTITKHLGTSSDLEDHRSSVIIIIYVRWAPLCNAHATPNGIVIDVANANRREDSSQCFRRSVCREKSTDLASRATGISCDDVHSRKCSAFDDEVRASLRRFECAEHALTQQQERNLFRNETRSRGMVVARA